jgi:uncharacterized protein (DUF58 family)
MQWQSQEAAVDKRSRAELLLLALAALLLRGGERVRFISTADRLRFTSGRAALGALAHQLSQTDAESGTGLPPEINLPRHARVVLFGDFLTPLEAIATSIARLAAVPLSGHVMQILDPAEAVLPYSGRIRFEGLSGALKTVIPRVEGVRDEYARRLAAQQQGLADLCAAAGFGFSIHRTDQPPETALLALYSALSGR